VYLPDDSGKRKKYKFFLNFPEILFAFETYKYYGDLITTQQVYYRWNSKLYGCILPNQDCMHRICLGSLGSDETLPYASSPNYNIDIGLKSRGIKKKIELFYNNSFICDFDSDIASLMSYQGNAQYHEINRYMSPIAFFEKWAEGSKSPNFNILDCSFSKSIPLDEVLPTSKVYSKILKNPIIRLEEILSLAKN
jgi:hypothetical protein